MTYKQVVKWAESNDYTFQRGQKFKEYMDGLQSKFESKSERDFGSLFSDGRFRRGIGRESKFDLRVRQFQAEGREMSAEEIRRRFPRLGIKAFAKFHYLEEDETREIFERNELIWNLFGGYRQKISGKCYW